MTTSAPKYRFQFGGIFLSIELREVVVPSFGVPLDPPRIPASTYEKRCREAYARAGRDWLVVFVLYALIMAAAAIVHSHFRYAWTTAALIAVLWIVGQTGDWVPRGSVRIYYWSMHVVLGLLLTVLLPSSTVSTA